MAKFKDWNQINTQDQSKLAELRELEKKYKEQSGIPQFYRVFGLSSVLYSAAVFLHLRTKTVSPTTFAAYLSPIIGIAACCNYLLVDREAFNKYFETTKTINRKLKGIKQSIKEGI